MRVSGEVADIIEAAFLLAQSAHFTFITPELMLYVICKNKVFARAFENCGGQVGELDENLQNYMEEYMESGMGSTEQIPELSRGTGNMLAYAWDSAQGSGKYMVELQHLVYAMFQLKESYAVYYIRVQGVEQAELLREMTIISRENDTEYRTDSKKDGGQKKIGEEEETDASFCESEEEADASFYAGGGEMDAFYGGMEENHAEKTAVNMRRDQFWRQYAVCLNDETEWGNPLIGREEELERTMQILCRKEKNNPLHIGEPGVGKTAIVYGLAKLLKEGKVPKPLHGAKIFSVDLGSLLAGTQYRGDFEKRLKKVMDSISREEKPIVYIDEIHNLIGTGAVNGGSFDISNMLKPYLSAGHIRFIGATTYEEYKKYFEKSKSMVRRFQNIEIKEPDIPDAVRIVEGLKQHYEQFHGIRYDDDVPEYVVQISAKYMNERFLPDKAIDLLDEAGAYRNMHPLNQEQQTAGKELIDEIAARICHIPKQAVEHEEMKSLAALEHSLKKLIFGQDEAVSQVVNAVKFSRAGLLDEDKPLASLLFVGPTGVGKTEIAKSLAKEMGMHLLRFDMSEYGEKHAAAKLIGAPAGYVGYEEGGLLTEEIRRHPHAVLLLDEMEKAHPDIYHLLLQVMDYAALTDNQGRKADFRNIIIIMTSNAGARQIGKPGIGFQGEAAGESVVLEEVKRIFQPEFRNRLNKIVVFHGINDKMAGQIVEKKLKALQEMLLRKQVTLTVDEKSKALVKKRGISAEYGAREIERVIQNEIKPLFVDEILFGSLKNGGVCRLTVTDDNQFTVCRQNN